MKNERDNFLINIINANSFINPFRNRSEYYWSKG